MASISFYRNLSLSFCVH